MAMNGKQLSEIELRVLDARIVTEEGQRQKTMELNPKETPEQKKIRELEANAEKRDKKDADNDLKDQLRKKAAELKYDPLRAERFSVHGESALAELETEAKFLADTIKLQVDIELKNRFKTGAPLGTGRPADFNIDDAISEAKQAGDRIGAVRLTREKQAAEK